MRKVPSISGYALWLPSIISEMKEQMIIEHQSLFRRTPKCIETKEKFHRVVHTSPRRQTLKPIEINIKVHRYERQCLCRRTQTSIQTNTKVDRDEYLNP